MGDNLKLKSHKSHPGWDANNTKCNYKFDNCNNPWQKILLSNEKIPNENLKSGARSVKKYSE